MKHKHDTDPFDHPHADPHGRHGHRHHDGPEGPHRHRGGRDRARPFDHGELRLVILRMIADAPCHGYEIIKAIEDRMAGTYSPSPGVIYPTLALLEELGHATVTAAEGGRKLYTVTPDGEAVLAASKRAVETVMARMAQTRIAATGASRTGPTAPPILRAMENLKLSLRLRLSGDPLTEGQVDDIATALDTAARAVERI